ncbi:zinc finger protein ZAT12-like [Argentina anserina]|uniref:zinc finger protein ZAT12-like n=1 Tax=Argentina anserina TaxID=57926 RepID=UPI002176462F|nr:zinc finger protein ZAT12-like [Potentilla anserina]
MKRDREDEQTTLELVNCLMLLSKVDQIQYSSIEKQNTSDRTRVFVCKTCNRKFPSFQALGGHRASHKRPVGQDQLELSLLQPSSSAKRKKHECTICGMEFSVGQALGGHMRKHRDFMSSAAEQIREAAVLVLKKSNSSERVSCLNLDLNLAPPGYYDSTKLYLTPSCD